MAAKKLLTSKDVMVLFGVSLMTTINWRKGSPTRDPLPSKELPGKVGSVGFACSDVRRFAKHYGLEMTAEPESFLNAEEGKAKTCPKVKIKAAAPKMQGKSKAPTKVPAKAVAITKHAPQPLKGAAVKEKPKAPAKTTKTGKSIPALRKETASKSPTQAIAVKTAKGVVHAVNDASKAIAKGVLAKFADNPPVKKTSPLKGTKVAAKPAEVKKPDLHVVPVGTQQAA